MSDSRFPFPLELHFQHISELLKDAMFISPDLELLGILIECAPYGLSPSKQLQFWYSLNKYPLYSSWQKITVGHTRILASVGMILVF